MPEKTENFQIALEYIKSQLDDSNPNVCASKRLEAKRFMAALHDERYELRPRDAEFVIRVIEKTFVHIKGDKAGQPFILEPWEKFICYSLAGFYIRGTNERRFHEAFIFIPKKNGKTPFVAALAWAFSLMERRSGSELTIVANRLDRALESFNFIRRNIALMGEEDEFRILDSNAEHSISKTFEDADGNYDGSMKISAVAHNSEMADGINGNIVIMDEIHAYRKPTDYLNYKNTTKAYTNKLVLGITTAGKNMNSFCYSRLCYCKKVLQGTFSDEQYFIFINEADDKNDYQNPAQWRMANPNYGVTIRPADMEASALQAANDPLTRNEFLNKELNVYTNTASAYFDINVIQESDAKYDWTLEELSRLPVKWYGGADLSVMHDLTAADLFGEYDTPAGTVAIIISHGFIPVTTAAKKAEDDEIPFAWWQENGWLTMCNGNTIDPLAPADWFKRQKEAGFNIKCVGFDKYKSREFVRSMQRMKFRMENVDQQYWKKSEAFRYLEKKINDGLLYYCHNRAFEYCISNVKAVEDPEERVRFSKVEDERRIDLFDAAVIGCKQAIIEKDKAKKLASWF